MKSDESISWDQVYRRNYRSAAFWDIHWFRTAEALIHSARELESRIRDVWESYRTTSDGGSTDLLPDYYQGPYFMLISYAVENLLKGQIVRMNAAKLRAEFDLTGKLPKAMKGHDLYSLAVDAGFVLIEHDEDLFRRLTRCAVWAGRYPVPLHYGVSSGVERFSDGQEYRVSWLGSNDLERLGDLIERILKQFQIKMQNMPQHPTA